MTITEQDLSDARIAWGEGMIAISCAYESGGIEKARIASETVLDNLYGYDLGPVLFKPTLASGAQTFRPTRAGALSYFVGHDPEYPLDSGFGIKGWCKVETQTSAFFTEGAIAMWMGWVSLTDNDGNIITVDKSFGYKRDDAGVLKIIQHHSSLPYQP